MSYILTVTLNPCVDCNLSVDGFTKGGLNRVAAERKYYSGKGINVSYVLNNMSQANVATGILFGSTGKAIKESLDKAGIKNDFVYSDAGENRTNIKVVDLTDDCLTEINGVGAEVSESLLSQFIDKYTSLLGGASLVVLSGSAPKGVPTDIYRTLGELANQKSVKVILDADGELLKYGLEAKPFMIKPNIFELSRLFGKELAESEIEGAARELIGRGIDVVAVSMGGDGSAFVTRGEYLRAEALPIELKCESAAGDSMVAAMAYSHIHGLSLADMARYATAAGSSTAAKVGTEVCEMRDIEENVGKVVIR